MGLWDTVDPGGLRDELRRLVDNLPEADLAWAVDLLREQAKVPGLASRERLIGLIDSARFAVTRRRPGYNQADVDTFLREARAGLQGAGQAPLTAATIRAAAFSVTRKLPGYDQEEVDNLLDQLEAGLNGR
jgi:DivIVA domain-containing protein